MTMQLISTATIGSGGAENIEFTSIPQTYTDLSLLVSLRRSDTGFLGTTNLYLNGVTTGYNSRFLFSNGGVGSFTSTSAARVYSNRTSTTANTFTNVGVYIPNYAGNANKSYSIEAVLENNSTTLAEYIVLMATMSLSSTNAVTSLTITNTAGITHLENSTVSLYGITKGSDGIVTTS